MIYLFDQIAEAWSVWTTDDWTPRRARAAVSLDSMDASVNWVMYQPFK